MSKTQTVKAVQEYIQDEFWNATPEKQIEVFQSLLQELNSIWETQVILHCDFNNTLQYHRTGGGIYLPYLQAITLYKASLMTFLHEFAHALFEGEGEKSEFQVINWSHKIFKEALPETYAKALQEKKFFHIVP